mgnify:CR=1 FL=1
MKYLYEGILVETLVMASGDNKLKNVQIQIVVNSSRLIQVETIKSTVLIHAESMLQNEDSG